MIGKEVNSEFAKMNQDIYIKKLLKDVEECHGLLTINFANTINIFQQEMDTRIYEITYLEEDSLPKEEINKRIIDFFNKLHSFIDGELDKNKEKLKKYIYEGNLDSYNEYIEELTKELLLLIGENYKKEIIDLINELKQGLSEFSINRLHNLVLEIIYNRFINRVKELLDDNKGILSNNLIMNNQRLETMNNKTVVAK